MSLEDLKRAMGRNSFYDQLTISFSGYNIKEQIEIAVNSFLDFYPNLKRNIVVFDDDSTDGTGEWLAENGIRRITWSDKYRKIAKNGEYKHPSFYCSMIVNDIMYQVETKYLLINDGDLRFLHPFLEKYEEIIKDYRVIASVVPERYTQRIDEQVMLGNLKIIHNLRKYYRAWQAHMLVDLEYFKEIGLMYEGMDYMYYLDNPDMDSGAQLAYQLRIRKIPTYEVEYFNDEGERVNPYKGRNNIFEHAGYASCKKKYGDPSIGWIPR